MTTAGAAAPRPRVDITPLTLASRADAGVMVRSLESLDASVSVTQMRVLILLWTGWPLNLSAVAEGGGVNASNASRTCDQLVSASLVDRGELTADIRQRVLTLTRTSRPFVERLMDRRQQGLAAIVGRMSDTDRDVRMAALTPFNESAISDLYPVGRPRASRDPRPHEWGR